MFCICCLRSIISSARQLYAWTSSSVRAGASSYMRLSNHIRTMQTIIFSYLFQYYTTVLIENIFPVRNGQSNSRRNGDGTEPFLSFLPPDLPSLFTNSEARISADMLRPTTLQSASSSSSPVELTGHNESRRYGCPTSSHGRRVTRRRRCRRRTMSDSTCCDESKPDSLQEVTASSQPEASAQLWTQVGVNLRKIADEFYSSVGKVGTVHYHTFTRQSISPVILMQ